MYIRNLMLLLPSLSSIHALKLLVSSYGPSSGVSGSLQTLSLNDNSKTLQVTSTSQDCGSLASWLDLSPDKRSVLCVNEGDPGSLTRLFVKGDGKLETLSKASTLGGPVSNVFFGKGGKGIALAHYGPPALSTFVLDNNSIYRPLQNFTFPETLTGGNPGRQTTAHLHQALLDPSGQYLLFPDLGADLVRIYRIDASTNKLTVHEPLKTKRGYGPRHAVFWSPTEQPQSVFLFLIHELSNKIVSYAVTYPKAGGLAFKQVDEVGTFGNQAIPNGAGAAEILKSPDNAYILASNRLAPIFNVPNPDPSNSTTIKSDSIVTFKPTCAGKLDFVELVASGGLSPRHFSLNGDGSKVAIANGASKSVLVYSRDTKSGKRGAQVAAAYGLGPGDLTNVQWLEN